MSDISCVVSLDGQRIADTADTARELPTALDSLTVNWGRASQLEQPEAATCTFRLAMRPDDIETPALLTKGRRVTVESVAATWEPGMLNLAPDWQHSQISNGWISGDADTLIIDSDRTERETLLHVAPGPVQPYPFNPGAWDLIPGISAGQSWEISATVALPIGAAASLHAVTYTGPWRTAATIGPALDTLTVSGTLTAKLTLHGSSATRWLGFAVRLYPSGTVWDDMPGIWDGLDPAQTWQDYARSVLTDPQLIAPARSGDLAATVFDGGISTARTKWDVTLNCPVATITCTDLLAELGGTPIGDDPWTQQTAAVRLARILELAAPTVPLIIDPTVSAPMLAAKDVDAQPALGLAQTVAESVGGVLWASSHATTGPYVRLEDPAQRPALHTLTMGDDHLEILEDTDGGTMLSARHLLRDESEILRDPSTTASTVIVRWKDQTDSESEAERSVSVTDPARLATVGPSTVSIGTELAAAQLAYSLAVRILMRTPAYGWRMSGVVWDWDTYAGAQPEAATMIELLDATRRMGALILLTDLPPWLQLGDTSPAYLDGGTYQYAGARWTLSLNLTSANGEADAITWADLDPAWTWAEFDAITWQQLATVHT